MNTLSNAALMVIVTTLTEKITVQDLVCEGYEKSLADLQAHIDRHHLDMDDMQFTISDLRRQVNTKYEEEERMRTQINELYAQVRTLQTENHKLTYGGQTPEETANAYMQAQGATKWATDKIGTIKVCREVSGWGLKETKDFCEAYMARQKDEKEESPSGTKRSSQIPVGVGDRVRKSA